MSTIINGTSSAITFPDTTVQNTAFTTGSVTQSTIANGVAGTGPAFSAYQNSAQTLSSATWTKISFQAEEFDTANAFDSTTNYRFQPQVAGYYQISGGILIDVSATLMRLSIYKNGALFKYLGLTNSAAVSACYGSALIYLNGSTDYVELYGYVTTGQALNATNASLNYFQGALVRAA